MPQYVNFSLSNIFINLKKKSSDIAKKWGFEYFSLIIKIIVIQHTLEKVKLRSTKLFVTSQIISKLKYHCYTHANKPILNE